MASGNSTNDITFLVPGQVQQTPVGMRGTATAAVRVGTERAGGEPVRVSARPGSDVVVLEIANGPTLVLHPADARDLMLAQSASVTRSALAGTRGTAAGSEVLVSARLGWPGIEAEATRATSRGWLGQALLTGFSVLTDIAKDPAAKLAAAAITRKVDGRAEAGVYRLSADALAPPKGSARLDAVPAGADGGPLLVFVHGTFSDTVGTFGKLWTLHSATVRQLFARYGERVYAFDHPTLGTSPIGNALTLVQALPPGARLHLVTHSRGGLVAEALARACASGKAIGNDVLALFAGDDYEQHRSDLRALVKEAQQKGIRCERVVRVACPARGTLLASKRLDAYLSVLNWCLELANISVAAEVVDFLFEVARRRAEPGELPGLEAMMPDSPVIAWLNGAADTIPGELRVVAGDMEGDSIGSWVKTLLSDAFYWTDNDLVVQTRSMYGGTPRAKTAGGSGARFLLDKGAAVSHFNYFSNERTVQAIASALLDELPADFAAIGPLSWAGEDASGTRAAVAVARSRGSDAAIASERPAVFVIPGILGSNLKKDGKRIWLGFRIVNGLKLLAWDPATAADVEPDGPIGDVYGELIERLADTHEVIPFAFDWRRPIEDEARRLGAEVDAALAARATSQQPVRIVAHSMGGLVARTMALERPDTWARMMARDGARFVMLGTPNGGSWSPMQTLSGDDTFGNALAAFGSLFDNRVSREVMAGMPGFLQLQAALTDPALGLDRSETWQKLADEDVQRLLDRSLWHDEGVQKTVYQWSAPPQAVLDQAVALRRRLDAQAQAYARDAPKTLLVIGRASFTPGGFVFGDAGLEYTDAIGGGDGRVPLTSALLPGVRTWRLDATHGDLPNVAEALQGYVELLVNGDTALLEAFDPSSVTGLRAAAAPTIVVRSRPSRSVQRSAPPSSPADILGVSARAVGEVARSAPPSSALHVSVLNADLKFVHQPLVVGHYRSLVLTGTEAVVDRLVSRAMSRSLATGLYPEAVGTHQIFGNLRPDPNNVLAMARPLAAIVAGLGEEGKLRAVDLVYTVRQAVIAYAQALAGKEGAPAEFELAATLIGSGGTGISAGSAARLVAQGTWEANQKLHDSGWPQVGRLILVEFYLDRASEAWRSLQVQATAASNQLKVVGFVQSGAGALRRSLDSSYRGTPYDFISATVGRPENGAPTITYTLDSRRARTEVRAQKTQTTLVKELVAKASNDANRDPQIGRTLFDLLVPVEMEPFLGGTSEMVIELEPGTAALPWEVLDTSSALLGNDPRPWAIRSKLLRKLRTREFRSQVSDADADGSILVIGEPLVDESMYPPLPGARAEAIAVATRLTSGPAGIDAARVRALTSGNDARDVINALFERPYRIVHVAGHGAPGPDGGVVLSGGSYFGAAEVNAMRVVPELVFLNCCHLAALDANTVLAPYDRAAFAATIAESLIEVGVRCVIAAGWAVEDLPAELFATTFYDALLSGSRFIDAVAAARTAAWRAGDGGNTWAAYQCYGDPGWTWQRDVGDAQRQASLPGDEFADISSPPALTLALETISIRLRFGGDVDPARQKLQAQAQRDKIRFLEEKFAPLWGAMGAVAEAFGLAYADARDVDKAIEWYRAAVQAADGSASFQAAEELGNQLARRGESKADATEARRDVEEAIARLERLVGFQPTVEREALLGSAYKRLVMIEGRADAMAPRGGGAARSQRRATGGAADSLASLRAMALHYGNAERLARLANADNVYYPAKNGISAELRLAFLERRPAELSIERVRVVQESLARAARESPDFWSVVGQIELRLLEAVAAQRLAETAGALIAEFSDLKARVPARSMWDSVYSEARFTLEPYKGIASAAEQLAAKTLLDALSAMASEVGVSSEEHGELIEALLEAFTPEALVRRVMDPIGVPPEARSAARDYRTRISELVRWASANGRIGALLRAGVEANPNSRRLGALNEAEVGELTRGQAVGVRGVQTTVSKTKWDQRLLEVKRQICAIEVRGGGTRGVATGTASTGTVGMGFLVGPDQVMTHTSVLGSDPADVGDVVGAGITVVFDAELDVQSRRPVKALPRPVFLSAGGVLVLRLERAVGQEIASLATGGAGARSRGWVTLDPSAQAARGVVIAHYAEGTSSGSPQSQAARLTRQLLVSTEDASTVRQEGGLIYFLAPTHHGAAGAPCFDADWRLLGLHVGTAANFLSYAISVDAIGQQLAQDQFSWDASTGMRSSAEDAKRLDPQGSARLDDLVRGFELPVSSHDPKDDVWSDDSGADEGDPSDPGLWAWAEAAAVVAYFEPQALAPLGDPSPKQREVVLLNSSRVVASKGRYRWLLAERVRMRALERLAGRGELMSLRERNPGDPEDLLDSVFASLMSGSAPTRADLQDVDRVRAMMQAVGWLSRTGLSLPDVEDLRANLERATLLAPFRHLTRVFFAGRERELSLLAAYVDASDVASGAAIAAPIFLYGPGGMGKSAVLAHFILAHSERDTTKPDSWRPFVYLDFDRPELDARDHAGVLLAMARQIASQVPAVQAQIDDLIRQWTDRHRPARSERAGARTRRARLVAHETRADVGQLVAEFGAILRKVHDLAPAPILLVLDTIEEVQYATPDAVTPLVELIVALCRVVASLRPVFSGRVDVDANLNLRSVELGPLPSTAAETLLTNHLPPALASKVDLVAKMVQVVGGNPLSLRLAAEVLARETFVSLDKLGEEELWRRVGDSIVQGQLYERIAGHLHEGPIRELAIPGLVLRYVTWQLIRDVLAGACGIEVKDEEGAKALFGELAREIALVRQGDSQDRLVLRPELRRTVLENFRKDAGSTAKRLLIHEKAVGFFAKLSGADNRAEEIYHRLWLDQDPPEIDARWLDGVDLSLRSAVEELEGRARVYLASRVGALNDQSLAKDAPLAEWEAYAERRASDLLRLGSADEALKILAMRSERLPTSRLYLVESIARRSIAKPDLAASEAACESALAAARTSGDTGEIQGALQELVQVRRLRGDNSGVLLALAELGKLGEQLGDDLLLLEAEVEELESVSPDGAAVGNAAVQVFSRLPDEILARAPELARRVAAQAGGSNPLVLKRVVGLVGLGALSQEAARGLHDVLVRWSQQDHGVEPFVPKDVANAGELASATQYLFANRDLRPETAELFSAWLRTALSRPGGE